MKRPIAAVLALADRARRLRCARLTVPGPPVPRFEVDASWPKLPPQWVFGQVSSVSIDERGHAWVLQRPGEPLADRGEADRARALLLTLAGWTSPRIAEAFGVREDTVRLWRSAS